MKAAIELKQDVGNIIINLDKDDFQVAQKTLEIN